MGMTDEIYEELAGDIERHWFEGKTAFCRFAERRAVTVVYSFAALMNKMAKAHHVVRKLHLWIQPALETRFFQLKDLEWQFRRMKKAKGENVHTRIAYAQETIIAEWRSREGEPYKMINKPASQHIAGVEFFRTTSSKTLNNRGNKPLPLPKPAADAPTPKGRTRPSEAARGRGGRGGSREGSSARGRGGGRGGGSSGSVATPGTSATKDKTPASKKREVVVPAGAETSSMDGSFLEAEDGSNKTEESLNTNAVGQLSDTNSKAKKGNTRGRKPRSVSSQSNTMLTMGWASSKKKRSRSSRRDSIDEELCEENKSQRMTKVTPKKTCRHRSTPSSCL